MKKQQGNSDIKCGGIIKYDYPRGQIIFNVEKYVDEENNTKYRYDYAECENILDRSKRIEAIIRSRYTQDEVEAIFANHLAGKSDDYTEFQTWRSIAKQAANGIYNKEDLT